MAENGTKLYLTLEELNDNETGKRTSAIVYLSIVMALGIPGNLLVIIIYFGSLRRRDGAHWMYIRALAITDFLVCVIAIPFELYQQTHQLTFYSEAGCKIFRAISVHLSLMSSFVLIVMSGNRLRRVCQPLKKQMTPKQGLISIAIIVLVAVLFCWPEGALSGISLEDLPNNLTGYDCSFSDRFTNEDYTTVYSTLLLTVYISCMAALVVIYAIVGREVIKRAKVQHAKRKLSAKCITEVTSCEHTVNNDSDTIDDKPDSSEHKTIQIEVVSKNPSSSDQNDNKPKKCKKCQNKTDSNLKASKRVTRIAFAISTFFIVSYLPYVAVKLNASVVKGNFVVTPLTKAIFPILARTYILNNIMNPILYGFLDPTFLQHCKLLFRHILCLGQH